MKKVRRKVKKAEGFTTLYARKIKTPNAVWIKQEAKSRGYCPSVLLNRLVEHARKETELEML